MGGTVCLPAVPLIAKASQCLWVEDSLMGALSLRVMASGVSGPHLSGSCYGLWFQETFAQGEWSWHFPPLLSPLLLPDHS